MRITPGAVLASLCPPCAERAKVLRATQCREGWHLDQEPVPQPPPPDDRQRFWIEKRANAQAVRDHAGQTGDDTAELDELITELDGELAKSGLRGKAAADRQRSPGTGLPAAEPMPLICPSGRSAPARSARPTPPATARRSGRRCSSP